MLMDGFWAIPFICLFMINAVNATYINEIMYNPIGDDNNKEYVEVYLSDELDLRNFTISDSSSSDSLKLLKEGVGDYALITEDGFDASGLDVAIYSAGARIGNGLNNKGDEVTLKDRRGNTVDKVIYTGRKEGFALCKENGFKECEPTPGEKNILSDISAEKDSPKITNDPKVNKSEYAPESSNMNESYLTINKANEDARFGDIIKINLDIYKGGSNKNSIRVFISDGSRIVSEETKFNIYGKFVNLSLVAPVLIKKTCDENSWLIDYIIVAEGLDARAEKEIKIGCDETTDKKDIENLAGREKVSFYSFSFVLIMLIIFLLFKRMKNDNFI